MSTILNCGIVGYGYMGEIREKVINDSPHLNLLGIVEPNVHMNNPLSNVKTYTNINEFFQVNDHIDIMFVCTPNAYSPKIAIQCMNRGIHVFCEKPPGRNLNDIQQIIEAERKNQGIKLMFGFNHRFHPAVLKAKAVAESGRLGTIMGLRGIYGKSGGSNYRNSWRNNKAISGGGILLDQGIHMLDLFRFFCGNFEHVKCFLNDSYWKMDVEDNAYVILSNQNNQNAFFHSSATLWKHTFRLDIMLEEGYMIIEGLLSRTGSYGREKLIIGKRQFEDESDAVGNPTEEMTNFDRDLSWELEVDEFIKCIQNNLPVNISSSDDAYHVMHIIDKAYQDAGNNYSKEEG